MSTYPPRKCGIATFTQDLVSQMSHPQSTCQSMVVAVSDEELRYDKKVMMALIQDDRSSYTQTAQKLNCSDVELLVIEHEFGIYGGECGEYLLDLADNLQIPFMTTLHTVPSNPNKMQRYIIRTLAKKGEKIITMAVNTVEILKNVYGILPSKIKVINYGVPFMDIKPRARLKADSGLKNRFIISTSELISPGKGLEYGIEAIAEVVEKHQNVLYFILGKTHPKIIKESGEDYRKTLESLVEKLGIQDNVRFVNKDLTKGEIISYLNLSDIYLSPNLDKAQAVSGVLAYAVGYGRVIVSTPYSYAKEMLSEGRGLLAEFANSESIANCIEYVLENTKEKKKMEQKTLKLGKAITWEQVGTEYKKLFIDVVNEYKKFTVCRWKAGPADSNVAASETRFAVTK